MTLDQMIDFCKARETIHRKQAEKLQADMDKDNKIIYKAIVNLAEHYKEIANMLSGRMNEVIIDGTRYYSKKPTLKTIHRDGEVTIGNFWEVEDE